MWKHVVEVIMHNYASPERWNWKICARSDAATGEMPVCEWWADGFVALSLFFLHIFSQPIPPPPRTVYSIQGVWGACHEVRKSRQRVLLYRLLCLEAMYHNSSPAGVLDRLIVFQIDMLSHVFAHSQKISAGTPPATLKHAVTAVTPTCTQPLLSHLPAYNHSRDIAFACISMCAHCVCVRGRALMWLWLRACMHLLLWYMEWLWNQNCKLKFNTLSIFFLLAGQAHFPRSFLKFGTLASF